jgi:hypothetical protein
MERNKSISRAKKSATTMADLLGREGASLVLPGGGLIYDTTKVLIDHAKNYFSDRTTNRIEDFHTALLQGNADQDKFQNFLNMPFELDDYYTLLSSCIQDIEAEKVDIYSSLMKSFIKSELGAEIRRHFIISCKELTNFDISFLKNLYINSKNDLMTVGGIHTQIKKILSTKNELEIIAIEKLKKLGFIELSGKSITSLAEKFIDSIFTSDELLPAAIGQKQFSGVKIVIVSYQLGNIQHINVATQLQAALWSRQIKSSIHIIDGSRSDHSAIFYNAAILITDEQPINDKYITALAKFSKQRPIIRLNISDSPNEHNFEKINFSDELNLNPSENTSIKEMVFEYLDKLA